MFRKAGIIVGIVVILLAVGIYWFAGNIGKDETEVVDTSVSSINGVQSETQQPVQEPVTDPVPPQPEPVVEPPVNATPEPTIKEPKQVFTYLNDGDLGEPTTSKTEVMVVSEKKILLLDSSQGENSGKQLSYVLGLLYNKDKTMDFFLNGVVYESINVGDKLKVTYNIYRNDIGVEFPIIVSVETIE